MADALARAVAASGAPAAVWGLLADFHRATGFRASEREALLKQVHHVDDVVGGMPRTRVAHCDEQAHCSACYSCPVHARRDWCLAGACAAERRLAGRQGALLRVHRRCRGPGQCSGKLDVELENENKEARKRNVSWKQEQ